MDARIEPVATVVLLFMAGLLSPGPNFLVVADTTLKWGRFAGFITGLGAATGDALYAGCALFGVGQLLHEGGRTVMAIRMLGGLYLVYMGAEMLMRRGADPTSIDSRSHQPMRLLRHFVRGLTTDLSNPKTLVFFASIFAVTVGRATALDIRMAMLIGIVLTSVAWRSLLSVAFSTSMIRRGYQRSRGVIERVFGAALCLFGARLVKRAFS